MKTVAMMLLATMLAAPAAFAAGYQKTGIVKDVTDKAIVITTDKDGDWEFKRDADTKIEGDAKKGAKVTVSYTMSATKVVAKADAKKDDKKK